MSIQLKHTNNGRMLSISKDNKALRFMVPRGSIPYGFNEYVPPNGGNSSISLEIALSDKSKIDEIRDIENQVITQVADMSPEIFSKKMSVDEVRAIFNSNLKNDRLRLKHTRSTRIFDSNGEPMGASISNGDFRNAEAASSATVNGVYFMNMKMGLVWYADHIKIWPTEKSVGPDADLSDYAFRD